jgi:multidrug efflux pump subunit AcrA (membrane-fusion protein)
MVHVVAEVEDPYGHHGGEETLPLAVGMFVEAEITGRLVSGAVVIPRTALRDRRVLVVDGEDRLHYRDVEVLRVDRGSAVIVGGLDAGERVCVSTLEAVSDGMKVRAVAEGESGKESSDGRSAEGKDRTETAEGSK